ncbi:hypothetical protein SLE2022_307310 [Rubroshorea leprosula]
MKHIKSQSLLLSERYTQIDIFENRSEIPRVLGSDMANESSYDVLHGVGNEHEILQLSDAACAEELQFQEALQMSMIPPQMKRDDPLSPSSLMPSQLTTPALTVKEGELSSESSEDNRVVQDEDVDGDDGAFADTDEHDSASIPESHETGKNNKLFKKFFEEEINKCQWHCPACKGGPGAVTKFQRLQDLITHAKTEGARRVKLHREFAKLLEAEVKRKRPLVTPAAAVKVVRKWKGLKEEKDDHQIVWPPMVVIRNTSIPTDNKWIGMRNLELLQQFSSYEAIKARHFYGPQGHLGISLLIFEKSVAGYTEAERLHKSFSMQGIGRDAWNSCPAAATMQGGARQLYGYLAAKDDLDFLNRYCRGKLKYEMKSYREVIVNQIKKLSDDSQQLIWVKQRLMEEEMHVKDLEESVCAQRDKLHLKTEEMSKLRQRIQQQHEEHEEETKFQENFFMDQIRVLEAKLTKEAPGTLEQADSDIFQIEEYEET